MFRSITQIEGANLNHSPKPNGGVRKGMLFTTPMLQIRSKEDTNGYVVTYDSQLDSMRIPRGRWRDGLFHCVNDPLVFLSFFFPHGEFNIFH